ncbi:unnamed protein product [Leptidea sinapis]|uniref:Protein quiver n=1 Tax=Leptidea sinapis TaxID=189913 RepID=A0A5E4PZI4_9NEOP|nr:unnamed protein product [Leptidea sinapis]
MAYSGVTISIALLALFDLGSCLQCYQCNSQSDPTCKDPFGSKNLVILPRDLVDGKMVLPYVPVWTPTQPN